MTTNGRSLGKLEQGVIDIKETLVRIEDKQTRDSQRIGNLEKWRWLLTGATGTLAAINWPEINNILAFGG